MEKQEMIEKWREWSGEVLRLKTVPMSDSVTQCLLSALMAESQGKTYPDTVGLFAVQVAIKRAAYINLAATENLLVFIAALSNSPGKVVMYLYALRYWQLVNNPEQPLTANMLCHIFPMGFPTEDEMHRMWDAQKLENGANLLDQLGGDDLTV